MDFLTCGIVEQCFDAERRESQAPVLIIFPLLCRVAYSCVFEMHICFHKSSYREIRSSENVKEESSAQRFQKETQSALKHKKVEK